MMAASTPISESLLAEQVPRQALVEEIEAEVTRLVWRNTKSLRR